jgi:choline dehydrogenase-like flavoprotein
MRRLGSFLPGEVVGGSGVHWSGHTWRWTDMEFKVRSLYEERYGRNFIPADMTIQDWGITYAELEPYYDRFEYVAAVSGKAGNLRGQIQPGGNPFEAPRARDYPLPPLTTILAGEMFTAAAKNNGYHPFPRPAANASRAYTNPDGAKFGACQYCGYCQRFGCEANAKGSPHITVIPMAMRKPNFELRTHSWVTKVLKDSDGRRVTGVTYTNVLNGEEFEQPAGLVLLCAYAINNVHLMLLSQIGAPYDPGTQTGVIGKNYCYQTGTSATLFFEGRQFNPFMSAGGSNITMDDFNINWQFDRAPHGFVGGYNVAGGFNTLLPIGYREPAPDNRFRAGRESKFIVGLSGNLGFTHSPGTVFEAARLLQRDKDIHFILSGWGIGWKQLKELQATGRLTNITLLDPVPQAELVEFLSAADVWIIPYRRKIAGVSVPSRMYNLLAIGRAIIVAAEPHSEAALVVNEEAIGWAARPEDPHQLANAIRLAATDRGVTAQMGRRAAAAAEKYCERTALARYRDVILNTWAVRGA